MRSDNKETGFRLSRISRFEQPGLWSALAGIRCPDCNALQPCSRLLQTTPWRGRNKHDAHKCFDCGAFLYLSGRHLTLKFWLLHMPVFFGSALLGMYLFSKIDVLTYVHPARGPGEPNFIAFLLTVFLIVLPAQLFLTRFNKVSKFDDDEAASKIPVSMFKPLNQ